MLCCEHPRTGGVDHPGAFGEVWGLNQNWGALKKLEGSEVDVGMAPRNVHWTLSGEFRAEMVTS